jgi:hypothetical protein
MSYHQIRSITASMLLIFVLTSCDKSQVNGFDSQAWKSDKDGCNGVRVNQIEFIDNNKEAFQNLHPREITKILGQADRQELFERSQRVFKYYYQPSDKCEEGNKQAGFLQVRFNALNRSNEIIIFR